MTDTKSLPDLGERTPSAVVRIEFTDVNGSVYYQVGDENTLGPILNQRISESMLHCLTFAELGAKALIDQLCDGGVHQVLDLVQAMRRHHGATGPAIGYDLQSGTEEQQQSTDEEEQVSEPSPYDNKQFTRH